MKRSGLSILVLAASLAVASETAGNSVDDMLVTLRSRPDVTIETQAGWTIAIARDGLTLWSFTPADHPAHPAYVERRILQRDGAWHIEMNVKCGAEKSACDQLVADFRRLNEQLQSSLNPKRDRDGR